MKEAIRAIESVADNLENVDPHSFEPVRAAHMLRQAAGRLNLIETNVQSAVDSLETIKLIENLLEIKSFYNGKIS